MTPTRFRWAECASGCRASPVQRIGGRNGADQDQLIRPMPFCRHSTVAKETAVQVPIVSRGSTTAAACGLGPDREPDCEQRISARGTPAPRRQSRTAAKQQRVPSRLPCPNRAEVPSAIGIATPTPMRPACASSAGRPGTGCRDQMIAANNSANTIGAGAVPTAVVTASEMSRMPRAAGHDTPKRKHAGPPAATGRQGGVDDRR